jgi:hypothetical protein
VVIKEPVKEAPMTTPLDSTLESRRTGRVAAGPITIRTALRDDYPALNRLAGLDSRPAVPPEPLLLGEIDGHPYAALSLTDESVIADPFYPTADLVSLLRTHAHAIGTGGHGRFAATGWDSPLRAERRWRVRGGSPLSGPGRA